MKYRRLTLDELQELETEFVRFLAANTVTSDEWTSLKTTAPDKAERLIELFSDVVFDKIIDKIEYLEHRTKSDLKLFKCGEARIELIGIKVIGADRIDFTQQQTAEEMLGKFRVAPNGSVKMFTAEKGYKNGDRPQELFKMMQDGCLIAQGELFESLRKNFQ